MKLLPLDRPGSELRGSRSGSLDGHRKHCPVLKDDGGVPSDNPFVGQPDTGRRSIPSGIVTRWD